MAASTSDAKQATNKVVISGGPKSGKKYLLTKIIDNGTLSLKPAAIANIQQTSWLIDNKYYQAHLDWWLAPTQHIDITDEKANAELGRECQALVLAFDLADEASFDCVKQYALFVAQYNPAVLLLAANERKQGASTTPLGVRLQREAQDFALDNQMELVFIPFDHVHAGLPKPPPPPPETGAAWLNGVADDREKNGTDRMVEALHCNTWNNMKMKPKPTAPVSSKRRDNERGGSSGVGLLSDFKVSPPVAATPAPAAAVTAPAKVAATPSAPGQCDSCDDAKATLRCDACPANLCASCAESEHKSKLRRHHTLSPLPGTTPPVVAATPEAPTVSSPATATVAATPAATPAVAVAVTTTATPVVAARAAAPTKVRTAEDDLASMEGLDALVDRLRSVRGDAQNSNGGGNDEDRRRRAAQAVMAMMGQLGLEDDDDEDDLLADDL